MVRGFGSFNDERHWKTEYQSRAGDRGEMINADEEEKKILKNI